MTDARLTAEDREAVLQLLSLDVRVLDTGAWDRAALVFAPDATFDLDGVAGSDLDAYRSFAERDARANHHLTNPLVEAVTGGVRVWSRLVTVRLDASATTHDVVDVLPTPADGSPWRIVHRRITPRRPLSARDDGGRTETFDSFEATTVAR